MPGMPRFVSFVVAVGMCAVGMTVGRCDEAGRAATDKPVALWGFQDKAASDAETTQAWTFKAGEKFQR